MMPVSDIQATAVDLITAPLIIVSVITLFEAAQRKAYPALNPVVAIAAMVWLILFAPELAVACGRPLAEPLAIAVAVFASAAIAVYVVATTEFVARRKEKSPGDQ